LFLDMTVDSRGFMGVGMGEENSPGNVGRKKNYAGHLGEGHGGKQRVGLEGRESIH